MGSLFERVQGWIDADFDESNRGVVIYAEVDGDWFEALQFPVPVQNRLVVADRPVIGPLAQVLNSYEHYGVILMDREHVRILSVYLGTLLDELEFRGDPHRPRRTTTCRPGATRTSASSGTSWRRCGTSSRTSPTRWSASWRATRRSSWC